MRQGDPLSPYLFVTAVEILAIAVRNKDSGIKGIESKGLETKLLQFTDDTRAVSSDLQSANTLFSLLEESEKASGRLNVQKTEAMWIGFQRGCEDRALNS